MHGLPYETAAVWRQERLADQERSGGWTLQDHLIAVGVEQTNAVFRAVLASIPTKTTRRLPPPLRIPRPGDTKPLTRRKITPVELMTMVGRR